MESDKWSANLLVDANRNRREALSHIADLTPEECQAVLREVAETAPFTLNAAIKRVGL
jgi:hypothetical protein